MRPMPRRTIAIGACAAMILAALATEASTASASPSWQLVDQFTSQPACYTTSGGTNDLEINLNGSWSAPINIGASGLPAGVSVAGTTVIDFYYAIDGSSYTLSYGTGPIPAAGATGPGRSGWCRNRLRKATRSTRKATWTSPCRPATRRTLHSPSRCRPTTAPPRKPSPCPSRSKPPASVTTEPASNPHIHHLERTVPSASTVFSLSGRGGGHHEPQPAVQVDVVA